MEKVRLGAELDLGKVMGEAIEAIQS
jgi:hypothetical protein